MIREASQLKKPGLFTRIVRSDHFAGYVFIAPWLLGFLVITIFPILLSLYLSFTKYDILSSPRWIGLMNYETMFQYDYLFPESLKVTFKYAFTSVPLRLLFALFLAVLLSQNRKGVGIYRTIYYVPSVFGGSVAVAVMWRQLFGVNGALNSILTSVGVIDQNVGWLTGPNTALWTLVALAVWQFGSPMLIFLAGLKQVPYSLYEAAMIDGASSWQRFIRITLPMISPIIFFNFLVQIINGFMMFTQALIVTNGGPHNRTLLYVLYVYRKAFTDYSMGYACALAWVMLLIVGVLTAIIFKTSSYWVFYETRGDER
ncbi:MAG: carbohydrate ABC transporter permease [Candidatus Wallacebacter cryptica]|nr:sugar ABC transporter permease [Bacillota bacterium]